MNFWDFYSFIGKDIDPPGGLEFVVDNLYNNYLKKSKPFNYLDIASHTGLVSRTIAKFNLQELIIEFIIGERNEPSRLWLMDYNQKINDRIVLSYDNIKKKNLKDMIIKVINK